jgi:hypothetical protein
MIVALLALFVALGGSSAYAINEWNGSNIQDNTIATADLKDGDVRNVDLKPNAIGSTRIIDGGIAPRDLDLLGKSTVAAEESTESDSPTDLATVGPSVTVNVPSSGMIAVRAQVQLKAEGGGLAAVYLNCGFGAFAGLVRTTSPTYVTRNTLPGNVDGTDGNAGWVLLDLDPGSHTCRLVYTHEGVSGTAFFMGRKLWVMAVD